MTEGKDGESKEETNTKKNKKERNEGKKTRGKWISERKKMKMKSKEKTIGQH